MTNRLKGKIALITGGKLRYRSERRRNYFPGKGQRLSSRISTSKRRKKRWRSISDAGGEAHFVRTDISKSAQVEALIKKIIEIYGRLDCAYQ